MLELREIQYTILMIQILGKREKNLMKKHDRLKDIVFLAMLSALAFVSAAIIKFPLIPSAPFLEFDIKDSIIAIGGLLYGPVSALGVSVLAALLQFLMTSQSGIIGFFMNLLSTASFVCTASAVYRFRQDRKGLVLGVVSGALVMSAVMVLWNYIVTPLFMGIPREAIKPMLFTVFLPFNLLKGGINAVIILLYYRPLMSALSDFIGDNSQ